jgi:phosphoribosylaminoimidazolecarboxamide formyltransferase / IMP cyclohydrolase
LRDNPEHIKAAEEHDIAMIDLVVVNLYPFEETVARANVSFEEAIEQIDIGGPSMLRSAAKNHRDVTVVCDPGDYDRVLGAMSEGGEWGRLRKELALKVFQRTSSYDKAISDYFSKQVLDKPDMESISGFPSTLDFQSKKSMSLRYGENPHQQAALYGEFERPTVAILKHTNPCGVASADDLETAWDRAYSTDQQAPFGGIIVVNNTMDIGLARKIYEIFCEVIIAPGFTEEALALFQKKKNLRLLVSKSGFGAETLQEIRTVPGGFLAQDRDQKRINPKEFHVVTDRQPSEEEWRSMLFGWRVVRHVKSNAIVYAGDERTLGVGAGQMARVDSSQIAVWKAGEAELSLAGSVVASDAFFPFPDGLLAAADAGATGAIQTGGSVRDEDVIAAANDRGMAMVFTKVRHFRH